MTTTTSSRPPPATTTTTSNRHRNTQNASSHQYYYSTTPSYFSSTSSSSPSVIKGCCCCLFLLFSLIALIILAVILIVVLAVKPKKPQYDLQQVAVQYVGISPSPSPNGASLSLSIRLLFTAQNPNKVGIKYGESHFTVMYRGIPLGRGSVPGFYQPAHIVRNVETIVTVDHVNLMQADASDLVKEASINDKVELKVLGDVSAKIRIIRFDSPAVQASVDCEIVISPRKQSLTYKQCGFDGLTV